MKATFFSTRLLAPLLEESSWVLSLRLTLLLLLLYGATDWMLEVPLRILCGLCLIWTSWATRRWVWILLAACLAWINALSWFSIDNHKYLITYWTIVCTLAVGARDPEIVLRTNARVLIGLCFLFAVVWKIIANEYFDGSFLHGTFLLDSRVEAASAFLGDLPPPALAENRSLLATLQLFPSESASVALTSTSTLKTATLGFSWWTLLIEGLVAVSFLVPLGWKISRFRDLFLGAFVATTYFLLPVAGFAFVLSLLGFSQCEASRTRTRAAYLLLFVLIQLTHIPWNALATDYLAG